MPVVISLLNSYSGLAASAAGFVIGNMVLIISGRPGRRRGPDPHAAHVQGDEPVPRQRRVRWLRRDRRASTKAQIGKRPVRSADAEAVAAELGYVNSVVIVPGYGLAVAQAQHELRKVGRPARKPGAST